MRISGTQTYRNPRPTRLLSPICTGRDRRCGRPLNAAYRPSIWRKDVDMECNHVGCRCEVREGQDYCGDFCQQELSTGMEFPLHTCRCGHEPCGAIGDPATHT